MLGFGATGQFAIGQVGTGAATGAEFIGPDKYMQAFRDPVRFKPGLGAPAQAFAAFNPLPLVSFSWMEQLSEPVRQKPRSAAAVSPYDFWQPAPSPFVATGWFNWLTEPVRTKPGLRAALQQALAIDTSVIPTSKLIEWFANLSEPVRIKPGLKAALQQFLAHPPQLRPTPTTTGALNALETKDTFLGSLRAWQRVVSGEVGVMEFSRPTAEIGVVPQTTPPGEAALIVEVTPPATSIAVAPPFSASISIRIV